MTNDQQAYVANITRYGLPLVVGMFYLTASLGFEFTADSTFQVSSIVKNGPPFDGLPSPLWQFLLIIGDWFHLNTLIAAKILSLVFSCASILVAYLVVHEVVRDRLIAFCVSLVMAMQGWLLQLAPSGSAFGLAFLLMFAGLFFMLRNEYVVAPFMFGLCTLVFWQAIFFVAPLCVDVWINSVSKPRAAKVMVSACIAYLGALLPWLLYQWTGGVKGIPTLVHISELPQPSPQAAAIAIVLGLLGCAGFVLSLKADGGKALIRTHGGVLMFMGVLIVLSSVSDVQLWLGILPLIVMYAFFGLAELLKHFEREPLFYSLSFVLTGLLLVHFQLDYYKVNKPAMAASIEHANELRMTAEWLRTNSSTGQVISAEYPGIVEYYAEKPVVSTKQCAASCSDLIVTAQREVQGYEVVFRPGGTSEVGDGLELHYAVWRRK